MPIRSHARALRTLRQHELILANTSSHSCLKLFDQNEDTDQCFPRRRLSHSAYFREQGTQGTFNPSMFPFSPANAVYGSHLEPSFHNALDRFFCVGLSTNLPTADSFRCGTNPDAYSFLFLDRIIREQPCIPHYLYDNCHTKTHPAKLHPGKKKKVRDLGITRHFSRARSTSKTSQEVSNCITSLKSLHKKVGRTAK